MVDPEDVGEDDRLMPQEKETTITWAKDQDKARVHTDMAGVARRLLHHPEFTVEDATTVEGVVVNIRGTIPIGCLSVSSSPRKSSSNADVVTSAVLRQ